MTTTIDIQAELIGNPVLRQVYAMYREQGDTRKMGILESQIVKGIEKYGHTVRYAEKTVEEWRQHRLEEEVDRDVYAVCEAMRDVHNKEEK